MKTYQVRLTADAIVSATITVKAESEEAAREWALEHGKDENLYSVDSLHEDPTVYAVS